VGEVAPFRRMDTSQLHTMVPLAGFLGIRLTGAGPEGVRLELDWRAELCTAAGILHGGALMSLADTAGALCAFLNLPEDSTGTTTVESKTNLLAAVREGTVAASARPLHAGSTVIVVETELRAGERIVAKTTQTQLVLLNRPAR
jgi:1,4-dihydroxy-2-naphthoyl-CoA hydrolase